MQTFLRDIITTYLLFLRQVQIPPVLTLVEGPRGVAVEGVQQGAEQVAEDGGPGAAGHQEEGDERQRDAGVT